MSRKHRDKPPSAAKPPSRGQGRGQERAPARDQRRGPDRHPSRHGEPSAPREAGHRAGQGDVWIYGTHAVTAALHNPTRKVLRVVGTAEALAALRADREIDVPAIAHAQAASRPEIDALVGPSAVHQGIAILVRALEPDLSDILAACADAPRVCLMVLDQVTDPHNVGAILRSAAAFGAAAVIAPERGAPEETGAMAKSASGALEVVPYVKGGNLVRVLEQLKEHGFWLVGLDAEAPQDLSALDLTGRIALLVGAEGEGLRRLVRETCDHLARLPMQGTMESLNVSNAAAIALYERTRQTAAKP